LTQYDPLPDLAFLRFFKLSLYHFVPIVSRKFVLSSHDNYLMGPRFNRRGLPWFAVAFMLTSAAFSSPTPMESRSGSIVGRVFDSATKDSIPLATVIIVGSTLGAATDAQGHFIIRQVPPGTYEVQASAVGYAPLVRREVVVRALEEAEVSFFLTEQSVQIGEIVITGKQVVIPDLPVSTEYLSYKEIQNTAGGFDDVVRTVSGLPGVVQTRPDRNDLMVRGGGSSENLFLIDNIEFPNIDHFGTEGTSGGSVSFVDLDFVENTSFSAGGFGVRYGDKLSSVLSIDTRDARTDEHRVKANVSATEAGLNLEGPVVDGGAYLFSARRSYLDPVFKYYGFAFAPYYWDFLGKVTYKLGNNDKLEALGIGAIDRIRFFNDTQSNQLTNNRELSSNQDEGVGGITWRHVFEKGYSLVTLRDSYSDFNYHQTGDRQNPHVSDSSIERESSLRWDVDMQVTKTTDFSFGTEGRIARLSTAMNIQAFEVGFTQEPEVLAIRFSRDTSAHKAGMYAQLSQTIGDLTMTGGVRADYLDIIKQSFAAGPRFSLSFALSPATKLTGSVGRYDQAPSYIWVVGNPLNLNRDLTFLKMNQYVVGIEHYLQSDLKISLEGYIKDYLDYPASVTRQYFVMVNSGTELRSVIDAYSAFGLDWLESGGTGYSHGVDLYIEKRLSETPLYARLTLSYSETMFTALDGVSRPSSNDQRWKFNIGGGYVIDEGWEVTSTFRFYTGVPYTPYTTSTYDRLISDYNSARVGVNHSMDVRVERRWVYERSILSAYLDVENIYNHKELQPPEWDQANNRPVQPAALGTVPSLGISIEF